MKDTPAPASARLFDLSHTIEHGMITYKGLPAPIVCDYLSRAQSRAHYAPGTEFQIGKIELVANTGTYIDSPFHRYADGLDIAELDLAAIANLPCLVVRTMAQSGRAIMRLPPNLEPRGAAVLFHTGWDAHWRTDRYFEGHPHLSRAAAEELVARGAALVGIDSYNIDSTDDGERPVHTVLLGAGIPIVEHLCNLEALPDRGARFYAVPAKVKGMGTFPVRAFARLP
jgi:kynurenine formamidase